jgi:hypothetical protein
MAYTTVDNPELYFQTKLWSGASGGGDQTITLDGSENMQPDWVWIKHRNGTGHHVFTDSVRGATKELRANATDDESTAAEGLQAFQTDGYLLGDNNGDYNRDTRTYVGWNWKAGTSFSNDASSTSVGSIDSAGSTNQTAGFSIVSWTGTGSAGTIAHSLSAAPNFMIIKNRDAARSWNVYFGDPTDYIYLNDTSAAADYNEIWNDTAPTSSVFSVGTDNGVNQSSEKYIGYLFAEKKGYSKFGSYTGNGNADGPFVYLGFKPAWLLIRNKTSGSENWAIYDNKRDPFNTVFNTSFPNATTADGTNTSQNLDFLSNGFKCKSAEGRFNTNGNTMIYMAFAESPFVNSKRVPTNAR